MTLTPEKVNGNLDQPTIFIRRISGLRHVGLNLVDLGGLFIGFGLLTVLVAALFGAVPALVMLGTVVAGVLLAAAVVRPAIALVLLIVFEIVLAFVRH